MKNLKNNKGVTLLILAITIIIILILAAIVTIAVLNANGILGRSQKAKSETIISQEKEIVILAWQACYKEYIDSNAQINVENYTREIRKFDRSTLIAVATEAEEESIEIVIEREDKTGYAKVTFTDTQDEYLVSLIEFDASSYIIAYNSNGGKGGPSKQYKKENKRLRLASSTPYRPGYTFLGWGTEEGSETIVYKPGEIYDKNEDMTLYAIWAVKEEEIPDIPTPPDNPDDPTPADPTPDDPTPDDPVIPEPEVDVFIIGYELDGGEVTGNPTRYTSETPSFELNNPTKEDYLFAGWSGTDIDGVLKNVVIPKGSVGNREYTAHWELPIYIVDNNPNKRFASLKEAIEACDNVGSTIKIINDEVTDSSVGTILCSKEVTLDLNGNTVNMLDTINIDGKLTVVDNANTEKKGKLVNAEGICIHVTEDGVLTLGDLEDEADPLRTPNIEGIVGVHNEGIFKFYDGQVIGNKAVDGRITETPPVFRALRMTTAEKEIIYLGILADPIARIDDVYYGVLATAIDSAKSDETVTLLRGIGVTDSIVVPEEKRIKFDLDGYVLSSVNTDYVIKNYGYLEIIDSSENNAGKIESPNYGVLYNAPTGTMKVSGGTIKLSKEGTAAEYKNTIYNDTGTLEIAGGIIIAEKVYNNVIFNNATTEQVGLVYVTGGNINLTAAGADANNTNNAIKNVSYFDTREDGGYVEDSRKVSNIIRNTFTNDSLGFAINSNAALYSNNVGRNNSVARCYYIIDLRDVSSDVEIELIINARVSSEGNYDFGYAHITENATFTNYNDANNRIFLISGNVGNKDYVKKLQGGKRYYLHLGYRKDGSSASGEDRVWINDISLRNMDFENIVASRLNVTGGTITSNVNNAKTIDFEGGYNLNISNARISSNNIAIQNSKNGNIYINNSNITGTINNVRMGNIYINENSVVNNVNNYSLGYIEINSSTSNATISNTERGDILLQEGTYKNITNSNLGTININNSNVNGITQNTNSGIITFDHSNVATTGETIKNTASGKIEIINSVVQGTSYVSNSVGTMVIRESELRIGVSTANAGKTTINNCEFDTTGIALINNNSNITIQETDINAGNHILQNEGANAVSTIENCNLVENANAPYGIYVNAGDVTIKNTDIHSTSSYSQNTNMYGIYATASFSKNINIENCNIIVNKTDIGFQATCYGVYNLGTGKIVLKDTNIDAGTENSTQSKGYGVYNTISGAIEYGDSNGTVNNDISIRGNNNAIVNYGIFKYYDGRLIGKKAIEGNISEVEADYEIVEEKQDDTETIYLDNNLQNIVKIVETGETFGSIQNAIDACDDTNKTIQILKKDLKIIKFVVSDSKAIKIDLNGNNTYLWTELENNGSIEFINSGEEGKIYISKTVKNNNYLKATQIDIISEQKGSSTKVCKVIENTGELYLENALLDNEETSTYIRMIYNNGGSVNLKDSIIKNNGTQEIYGIYNNVLGEVNVEGGKIQIVGNSANASNNNYGIFNNSQNIILPSSSATYKFIKSGNTLVSNNKGVNNSTANAYYELDLTDVDETEIIPIAVTASVSSEGNYDIGYATVTESTNFPAFNDGNGRMMYISGSVGINTYSTSVKGGKKYYIHLGYRKDGSNGSGSDALTIYSVRAGNREYLTTDQTNISLKNTEINTNNYTGSYGIFSWSLGNIDIENTSIAPICNYRNGLIEIKNSTIYGTGTDGSQKSGLYTNSSDIEIEESILNGLYNILNGNGNINDSSIITNANSSYAIKYTGEHLIVNNVAINENINRNVSNTILNGGPGVLDLNGITITNSSNGVLNSNKGTINLDNCTVNQISGIGINNSSNGKIELVDTFVTGTSYGVYNASGIIECKSGRVEGTNGPGIYNNSTGEIIIGEKNEIGVTTLDLNDPQIIGKTFGIANQRGYVDFYDGKIIGKTSAIYGTIRRTELHYGIRIDVNEENTIASLILVPTDDAVAMVNGSYYSDLQDAINACNSAENSYYITLLNRTTLEGLTISSTQNIVLDLYGFNVTANCEYAIINYGKLKIVDTSTAQNGRLTNTGGIAVKNNGEELTIGDNEGFVTPSPRIEGSNYGIQSVNSNSIVYINDGTIIGGTAAMDYGTETIELPEGCTLQNSEQNGKQVVTIVED